jgi:transglutaminase/protease-like cytokinesis protein 3
MNNIQIINAQQAKVINNYKDTKEKFFKTNAAIGGKIMSIYYVLGMCN